MDYSVIRGPFRAGVWKASTDRIDSIQIPPPPGWPEGGPELTCGPVGCRAPLPLFDSREYVAPLVAAALCPLPCGDLLGWPWLAGVYVPLQPQSATSWLEHGYQNQNQCSGCSRLTQPGRPSPRLGHPLTREARPPSALVVLEMLQGPSGESRRRSLTTWCCIKGLATALHYATHHHHHHHQRHPRPRQVSTAPSDGSCRTHNRPGATLARHV